MSSFIQSLGQLLLADEVVGAAPSLVTFFQGVQTAGTDPVKWILLSQQLQANLGAAQIGIVGAAEGQLSSTLLTKLAALVTKEQGVIASATAPAAPATPTS